MTEVGFKTIKKKGHKININYPKKKTTKDEGWLKCSCGGPFFKLKKDGEDNVYAYCMWCGLEKDKIKPKFLMTGLVDLEALETSIKNGGIRTDE